MHLLIINSNAALFRMLSCHLDKTCENGENLAMKFLDSFQLSAAQAPACTGQVWFGSTSAHPIESHSPVDGKKIGMTGTASPEDVERVLATAALAFKTWRTVPAPKRGEIVRQMGDRFRARKADLGALVSYEMGKSLQEGLGEVQEIIDICDFAVGLSRQLYGLTMHSERPEHRMYEQWHPIGTVGIISAFNFPVAVWAWNAMIAAVCGDVSVWKPSEKTPLSAIACLKLAGEVLRENQMPEGIFNLIIGDASTGEALVKDERVPLVSATGSTRMGKKVAQVVAGRLGRTILELGGNNAVILAADAELTQAIPSIVFGAVGTAGQRCTSIRRLIVHESIYEKTKEALVRAYSGLKIGSPLDEKNHVGPLIDRQAVEQMQAALKLAETEGARKIFGGECLSGASFESGCYVMPALVEAKSDLPIAQDETFAPILYLMKYTGEVEAAIAIQNSVKQGLSSSIFTQSFRDSEKFLSAAGSDCGIANVNIGTSGAEIGGAFGGEKDTGGGRESGSDAWKAYMRRQTSTLNYGKNSPLAQGIKFDV
jgi:aldehyde dehydrogenase (NAD+)